MGCTLLQVGKECADRGYCLIAVVAKGADFDCF